MNNVLIYFEFAECLETMSMTDYAPAVLCTSVCSTRPLANSDLDPDNRTIQVGPGPGQRWQRTCAKRDKTHARYLGLSFSGSQHAPNAYSRS